MSLQYSVTLRNNQLDTIETTVSTAPILKIISGSAPADCATAESGTVLVSITLPSDWMAAASSDSKALSGSWSDTAIASGTAGYFRVYDSTGTTCHIQGTCSLSGGGGDLILDNTSISTSQTVTVQTFTISAGNA